MRCNKSTERGCEKEQKQRKKLGELSNRSFTLASNFFDYVKFFFFFLSQERQRNKGKTAKREKSTSSTEIINWDRLQ